MSSLPPPENHDSASGEPSAHEPRVEVSGSRDLLDWLHEAQVSLGFTTYQTGKLFFVGRQPVDRLSIFERTFTHCMGLWAAPDAQSLWTSSLYQLWRFDNMLSTGEQLNGYDAVYVPRVGYTTGHLDIHDIAVEASGRVVFVNTLFSCLGTLHEQASFQPLWRPNFISDLAPEDRCHLNGLALRAGRVAYVTAVSRTDVAEGWREQRRDAGVVLDVASGETIVSGLSMPHSPRWYRDRLWLLNSGAGEFGYVDLQRGAFVPLTFCPGFLRGLCFVGDHAIVTLSLPRRKSFEGLALDEKLHEHGAEAQCGLYVINLHSGQVVHTLRIQGIVTELYDVVALPRVVRPMALGFKTTEIERILRLADPGTL